MSFNICSLNKDLLDLLKPEAARLLQVDAAQLFVEFKQRVFDGNDTDFTIVDLKPFCRIGFLLSVGIFSDDNQEYTYSLTPSGFSQVVNFVDSSQRQVFFDRFELDSANSYPLVLSYLEFRTK